MIDHLKTQVVSGVKWNAVLMVTLTVLQFVTLAILARLLSPSDFGLMGMMRVVIGFAQLFADMGLSNAIIQRQDVEEHHLSSFFWINIFIGMILFVCIVFINPLAALYFKQPNLSKYLTFAAIIFLITPVGQIFRTLLRKKLMFKALAKTEIAGEVVYSFSAIGLALAKFGVLSLIFGQLISSLFTVLLLFFIFRKIWLPRFHCNIKDIQSYFRFGVFQTGQRITNYLSANIDYLIIGRLLGPKPLGFYTLAYQLVIFPLTKINPIITKVAFPVFSKIQHDDSRMKRGYCQAVHYTSLLSFPMLAGMLVVAPEFIRLVYGAKWITSILVLQLLCAVGVLKSLGNLTGSIFLAKGRPDIGFYRSICKVILISIAVVIGANWGIVGVAVAILVLHIPSFSISQLIINKLIDLKLTQYFKAMKLPSISSGIMLAGIILLKMILSNMDEFPLFIITVAIGVIIYIVSYYLQDKTVFIELKSIFKGK